ncbi:MAG: putative glutamine amidotransferase [Verrucomicrobia bacterium ADurb.Bin345]|nr:MAG: putative glutamine amidotransferase [Verrucomicrobia bacterium ADurb.Bin345]
MKWLVTRGVSRAASRRYEDWLARLDIQCAVVHPGGRLPGTLNGYSALLLTGGGDVNPSLYGDRRGSDTGDIDDRRDQTELRLIGAFISERKPVFGICRGLQVLNVALRGRLIQHVPAWLEERGAREEHRKLGDQDSSHGLNLREGTRFADALAAIRDVNSAHHQALDPARLGNNLRVAALSPAGVIEAVEGTDATPALLGVQWHPERMPFDHPASSGLLRYMQELAARAGV